MFNTAKKLTSKRYKVQYEAGTKLPKTFICPDCLDRVKKHTDNRILQRKSAKNVVVGVRTNKKSKKYIALCSKCDFTKTR